MWDLRPHSSSCNTNWSTQEWDKMCDNCQTWMTIWKTTIVSNVMRMTTSIRLSFRWRETVQDNYNGRQDVTSLGTSQACLEPWQMMSSQTLLNRFYITLRVNVMWWGCCDFWGYFMLSTHLYLLYKRFTVLFLLSFQKCPFLHYKKKVLIIISSSFHKKLITINQCPKMKFIGL